MEPGWQVQSLIDPEEVKHGAVGIAGLPDLWKFESFPWFILEFTDGSGQDSLGTVALSLAALSVGFGGLVE